MSKARSRAAMIELNRIKSKHQKKTPRPECAMRSLLKILQQCMQIGQRMGRAPWNKQVHRQELVQPCGDFRATAEGAAAQGAAAHGDHHFGGRHGIVGIQQRLFHVSGNGAGHDDGITVPRRGHKIDAESRQVEEGGGQNIQVRFTGIAAGGRHLAQLEGAAEQFFEVFAGVVGQIRKLARCDQVVFFGDGEFKIAAEGDKLACGQTLTGAAENTTAQVDDLFGRIEGILGSDVRAFGRQFGGCRPVNRWSSAIARRQVDGGFGIGAGPVALFESIFQRVEHIRFTSSG